MFRTKYFYSRFTSLCLLAFRSRHQLFSTIQQQELPRWKFLWIPTTALLLSRARIPTKSFASEPEEDNLQKLIEKADAMYSSNNISKLYDFLKKYESSLDVEILWRLSRAARDYATKDKTVEKGKKKQLHYEAFEFAKRALDLDENHYASHKWFAITIGDIGDYEGVKSKISNAFLIRDHLERAIELNPNDATTIFCMGMWCYTFAEMPGWQHRIASFVFATPPSSTYKEAVHYFQKAERADPNFYSTNLLMLGKCFNKLGDMKRALMYLDRTVKYPAITNEDCENRAEAQQLMDELLKKK